MHMIYAEEKRAWISNYQNILAGLDKNCYDKIMTFLFNVKG